MKTTIITAVAVLVGVILGIKVYPCIQKQGWIVNPIAQENYQAAIDNRDAYYKSEETNGKHIKSIGQMIKDAGVYAISVSPGHYPYIEEKNTSTVEGTKGFLRFGSGMEQDYSKPFIATTSKITLQKGCAPILQETYEYTGKHTIRTSGSEGDTYDIKCN